MSYSPDAYGYKHNEMTKPKKKSKPRSTTPRKPSVFETKASEGFTPEYKLMRMVNGVLTEVTPEPVEVDLPMEDLTVNEQINPDVLDNAQTGMATYEADSRLETEYILYPHYTMADTISSQKCAIVMIHSACPFAGFTLSQDDLPCEVDSSTYKTCPYAKV